MGVKVGLEGHFPPSATKGGTHGKTLEWEPVFPKFWLCANCLLDAIRWVSHGGELMANVFLWVLEDLPVS